ncbi:hypothetical protein AB0G79_02580 [Streptomyces sp. NPDC020807]|uniref:hypothetical protein n=1 Tax=Streptomyces sp. NPDC020807 TaxID=3155119 RepID=UPI0033F0BF91
MTSPQRVLTALALAATAIGLGAGAAAADPLAGATGLLGPVTGAASQADSPLSGATGDALGGVTSSLPLPL